MSLVERAIKKLQDSGAPRTDIPKTGKAEDVVIGSLVSTGKHPLPEFVRTSRNSTRTDKIIMLDRKALRVAGLMPPEDQQRRFANEYRRIKRSLISAAIGRGMERKPNHQAIMVASALPGEGKTFTSINLAISMALEKDVTVLLVDADVAKPHISRTFGVEKEPGLIDVLFDKSMDVEAVTIPTDVPGLSIIPAGKNIETATELLGSQRMRQMIDAISECNQNCIMMFDSPPLLLTSESKALATMVGQIVIVVRAEFTLQKAVQEAIESLGEIPESQTIGIVLNQSEGTPPGKYYGYGDYYGGPAARPTVSVP